MQDRLQEATSVHDAHHLACLPVKVEIEVQVKSVCEDIQTDAPAARPLVITQTLQHVIPCHVPCMVNMQSSAAHHVVCDIQTDASASRPLV